MRLLSLNPKPRIRKCISDMMTQYDHRVLLFFTALDPIGLDVNLSWCGEFSGSLQIWRQIFALFSLISFPLQWPTLDSVELGTDPHLEIFK